MFNAQTQSLLKTLRLLSVAFAGLCLPVLATADDAGMDRFARAIGIYDQIEAQKVATEAQVTDLGRQQVQQALASFPGLSEEARAELDAAAGRFTQTVAKDMINSEKAVSSYLALVKQRMSPEDIESVTQFYESEVGRNFTQANNLIMGEWSQMLMQDVNTNMTVAMGSYVEELKAIISRHTAE